MNLICLSEVVDILLAIVIPALDSYSLVFHMIYSAYKLNKQGDNIQVCCTPFPILNQSVVPCSCLTSWISQETSMLAWFFHPFKDFPQFVVIHIMLKGFNIVSEAVVDVFLEFPCFLHDPVNVGNLISGSSAFSKPSMYIWNFSVHILLKPSLKEFEHNLASM